MLCLSGSAIFIMKSTPVLESQSLSALEWTKGGEMAGKMDRVTEQRYCDF